MTNMSVNDSAFCANCCASGNITMASLCPASPMYDHITVVPTVVMLVCVGVVGILGNGLVCVVQMKSSQKSSFAHLALHLAVYDFLSCAIVIPIALKALTSDSISEKTVYSLSVLALACSMITMLLIAVDRYMKVCKPLHRGISARISKYLFFVETGAGILYALPTLFAKDIVISIKLLEKYCCMFYESSDNGSLWITYNSSLVILFASVLVTFVWCYWHVIIAIRRRRQSIGPGHFEKGSSTSDGKRRTEKNSRTSNVPITWTFSCCNCRVKESDLASSYRSTVPCRRNIKTAKIVLIVGITIIVCNIPSLGIMFYRADEHIVDLFESSQKDDGDTIRGGFVLLCQVWYASTHAVNPIVYAFMEGAFRKKILTILKLCKTKVHNFIAFCLPIDY